jgi:sporulation protein YlmC with PRC-barrel domain
MNPAFQPSEPGPCSIVESAEFSEKRRILMIRTTLLTAVAVAALSAAPALAGPGGGGGGPGGGGPGGGMGHAGGAGVGLGAGGGMAGGGIGADNGMGQGNGLGIGNGEATRITTNPAIGISQGPDHASATGIANANSHSVLAGTATTSRVTTGALAGLTTGMTLLSNGTAVGTVSQIRTNANGSVAVVVVQGTNGRMFAIPAGKLTLANGTLTTTARLNGINGGNVAFTNPALGHSQGPMHASPTGIAHANSHSVLAAGAVASTALPGLATGMTVQSSTGTTLGTISQVVTDSSGNIRMVFVTSPTGQTLRLAPTTLTISGGVVTTTQI